MLFNLYPRGWFFDKNADGGSGSDADPGDDPEDETKKKNEEARQKSEEEAKKKKDEDDKAKDKKFSQTEVDQIIKDRLEREHKKSEEAAAKAKKAAEEDSLKKNQEWQKLAEQRETEIATLKKEAETLGAFKEQSEKYKGVLEKYLAETKTHMPKHVLTLLEKLDVVDALNYIADNAKELGVSLVGVPGTPKEKERKLSDDDKKKAENAASQIVHRNF